MGVKTLFKIKNMYTLKKFNWNRFEDKKGIFVFELEQKDDFNNNLLTSCYLQQNYNQNWDNETQIEIFDLKIIDSQLKEILTTQEERDEIENKLLKILNNE
jgi:uncharacterized protein with LGFP repeats